MDEQGCRIVPQKQEIRGGGGGGGGVKKEIETRGPDKRIPEEWPRIPWKESSGKEVE